MTSAAYQNLLASFLDEAKAARLAGNTEAVLAWELAAARLTQAKADSLQEWDAAGEAESEFVAKVREMEEPELCQRILGQWLSLGHFLNCLRGLEIPAPHAKASGIYFADEVREIVTSLLSANPADLFSHT